MLGSDYCHVQSHQPLVKQKWYIRAWNYLKRLSKVFGVLVVIAVAADLTGLYSFFTQNTKKDIHEELQPTADRVKEIQKILDTILEINYEELEKQYPLGYVLFYTNKAYIYSPYNTSGLLKLDWSMSKLVSYSDTEVAILLPTITLDNPGKGPHLISAATASFSRIAINKPKRIILMEGIGINVGTLVNTKDYIVGVVGIEQLDENQLREELKKRGL